jgi:hypothetical protein
MDESITLTSTMFLSGYPSVAGTLWQVGETDAAELARNIYKSNLEGIGRFNPRRIAQGLHAAV